MPLSPNQGLPGVKSDRSYGERLVRAANFGAHYLPGGRVINGTKSRDPDHTGFIDVLRPGLLMGKITATGLYAPSIIGVTQGPYTIASTGNILQLSVAAATELVRRVGATGTLSIKGPATAGGTVNEETKTYTAVDTATGYVTLSADLSNNYIAGSFVGAADGSEDPLTVIDDNDFQKVTDQDGTNMNVPFSRFLIGGFLDSSQIINWPSDTALRAWIVSELVGHASALGQFWFDHKY